MNRLRAALGALAAVAAVTLSLTTVSPAAGAAPVRPDTHRHPTIVIKDFGFSGDFVVRPGVRVRVVNRDSVAHTLTHDSKGHFHTGRIPAGGGVRYFHAPQRVGKFAFHCSIHPEMTGTLVVRRA